MKLAFAENPFSDIELAWLWNKYRRGRFPVASFPKRFARYEFTQLSDKGKVCAANLAYPYRRQIFAKSDKYDPSRFVLAVRHFGKEAPCFNFVGK